MVLITDFTLCLSKQRRVRFSLVVRTAHCVEDAVTTVFDLQQKSGLYYFECDTPSAVSCILVYGYVRCIIKRLYSSGQ
jgi:hypothetical protein